MVFDPEFIHISFFVYFSPNLITTLRRWNQLKMECIVG